MKIIRIIFLLSSTYIFSNPNPVTSTPTTTNASTQNRHLQLTYEAAKKLNMQAVAHVKTCETEVKNVQHQCDMLRKRFIMLQDKYEDVVKELQHPLDPKTRSKLNAVRIATNNVGRQAKEKSTTCATKTLAQAQHALQMAKETEHKTEFALKQAEAALHKNTSTTTSVVVPPHTSPIQLSHPTITPPIQTYTHTHDPHEADGYRAILHNEPILLSVEPVK